MSQAQAGAAHGRQFMHIVTAPQLTCSTAERVVQLSGSKSLHTWSATIGSVGWVLQASLHSHKPPKPVCSYLVFGRVSSVPTCSACMQHQQRTKRICRSCSTFLPGIWDEQKASSISFQAAARPNSSETMRQPVLLVDFSVYKPPEDLKVDYLAAQDASKQWQVCGAQIQLHSTHGC